MDEYLKEFEKIMNDVKKYFSKLYIPEQSDIQNETNILYFKIKNGISITNKDIREYVIKLGVAYDSMEKKFNTFANTKSKSFLTRAYESSVSLGKKILSDTIDFVKEVTLKESLKEVMVKIMKQDAKNAFDDVSNLLTGIYKQSSQGLLSEMDLTYSVSQSMLQTGQREEAIQGLTKMFKSKKLGSEWDVSGIKEEKLINRKIKQFIKANQNKTTDEIAKYLTKVKENGFIRIIDKNGNPRHYTTDYYSEMIVNQRLAEAQIRATLDLGEKNDIYIYEVTSHNSPNFCRVYEGTLHSDKYQGIDNIMGMDTIPTYHVNCKHRLQPSTYEIKK